MNDRTVGILEQYDLSVERTWKGRGAILFETKDGIYILKEYKGALSRLACIAGRLQKIRENGYGDIEEIIPNKEGEFYSVDYYRTTYIVKRYFEAKECNIREKKECLRGMGALGKLHKAMEGITVEDPVRVEGLPLLYELQKRNTELKRVRRYLHNKGQKSDFERFLQEHYDCFFEKAMETVEQLEKEDVNVWQKKIENNQTYCHGDYQYHNILMDNNHAYIINFEKMTLDNPIKDVYFYSRKLLEKNNWDLSLGRELIGTYNEERNLQKEDLLQLKYRFLYPEKFWKIVNYYYNSPKAWISYKNTEKLETVLLQEERKEAWIHTMFS